MKQLTIFIAALTLLGSCKKTSEVLEETPTLKVSEQNMSLVARHSSISYECVRWSAEKREYARLKNHIGDKAVYATFYQDALQTEVMSSFGHSPLEGDDANWIVNLKEENEDLRQESMMNHVDAKVVANANYDMTISGTKVNLKTTTEFFSYGEGTYYLIPLLIHDDPSSCNRDRIVDIAKPVGYDRNVSGYKVAAGKIDRGFKVNLDFEVDRNLSWEEANLNFGLIIVKKVDNGYQFINAFTK